MGCASSQQASSRFNINVHTTPALSKELGGEICIECDNNITCEWRQNGNTALLDLSNDRKKATNVPPGAYELFCTSQSGECVRTIAKVKEVIIPCIAKYTIEHASADYARDGKVTVEVTNINTEDIRYLWTTGIITDDPVLYDAKPGMYAVTLLSKEKLPVPFYHSISPALIGVKKNQYAVISER
jgi:hypothetical protein